MASVRINGVEIYYEIHGAGRPLFLVAGLASDSQSWGTIIEKLADHCQVVVFDNRGVGRTSPQDVSITIRELSDDCTGLARHLGWQTFNLLGHSMGGFVALDCAIRYPHSVDKLILAATAAVNSQRNNRLFTDLASCLVSGVDAGIWFRNFFYWIFTPRFFESETAVDLALRAAINYPYRQSQMGFLRQVKAITDFNCTGELTRIKARTLVIAGKEDLLFPSEICAGLANDIYGAEFTLIDKAAHAIHVENPQAFTEKVLQFILAGSH